MTQENPRTRTSETSSRVVHADAIYADLRDRLMQGKVSPLERITEIALADRYEVSRTPVREAITRLVSDGLLMRRNSGIYPYVPSYGDLKELYELRILLEKQGIRRIQEGLGRSDLTLLTQIHEHWESHRNDRPRPDASFVSEDESFHVMTLQSAGNASLVTVLKDVNRKIRPVRMFDYLSEDRMQATVDEHLAIIDLIVSERYEEAIEALSTHIMVSGQVVLEQSSHALSLPRLFGEGI
ncbi:MAG: GntR family transcriptional regulator [Bifidobacterium crudilactis]|nr:GntR family transcriptional regulator [Bifidobacterium crudilactis]